MKKASLFLFCLILLLLTTVSYAATFNVSTPAEFQTALTTASGNGEADIINVSAVQFNITSRLLYTPVSEDFALSIIGAGAGLTVLDGGNTTNILSINVNLASHDAANILIRGITFQNGNESSDAGGLDVNMLSADITVENCEFINNFNGDDGGGAHLDSNSGTITVLDTIFTGNEGEDEGGGLYAISNDGVVTLINNVFSSNTTVNGAYGGGAYVDTANGTLNVINNTFTGNTSGDEGGGLHAYANSAAGSPVINIYNNIVWGNTSPSFPSSADLFIFDATNAVSNVFNNDFSAFDRNGNGSLNQGNNINQNPLLSADFHLQTGSLAIDVGDNSAPLLPTTDFEGDSRVINGIVDMGADEYITSSPDIIVPTMNEWGMIIFVVVAGFGSIYYLRRKRVTG